MFVTSAFAQAASSPANSAFTSIWFFVLFFAIMYFFIIRPQRQQMKKREDMISAIRRGDNVVTGGGIVGKVTRVHEDIGELTVEIAPSVEVRVLRSTISNVRVKGQPIAQQNIQHNKADKKANKANNNDADMQDNCKEAVVMAEVKQPIDKR